MLCKVPLLMLVADPLLCLFSKSAPHPTVFRLWDVLFLEGRCAIFALLLALFDRNEELFSRPGAAAELPKALEDAIRTQGCFFG